MLSKVLRQFDFFVALPWRNDDDDGGGGGGGGGGDDARANDPRTPAMGALAIVMAVVTVVLTVVLASTPVYSTTDASCACGDGTTRIIRTCHLTIAGLPCGPECLDEVDADDDGVLLNPKLIDLACPTPTPSPTSTRACRLPVRADPCAPLSGRAVLNSLGSTFGWVSFFACGLVLVYNAVTSVVHAYRRRRRRRRRHGDGDGDGDSRAAAVSTAGVGEQL